MNIKLILVLTTGKELFRLEYLNNAWSWTKILDFTFTAGYSLYPVVNIYDGHIRYSDGSFTLNSSSPYLPLNKTLFYGQVRRKYFTATENTVSTITGNASIIKPTDGKVNFNKSVEITANRPTQGYLGLEVSKINNTILDGVSFGTDQAPTNPTESNSGNYSSYDTMAVNDEVTVLGESVTVINNDATTSVMRDMQVNKDYLLSAIATAQGSTASQVSFNSSGGYLEVGNGSSGESVNASFFITLDDKSNSHNFGTTRRSLRINGAFFQSGSSVAYSYLDYEPNVYPISEDGTVGSELTILTGNDANGNPNKDDNQNNFACFRFEDSTQALKYKVILKAGSNEQIRVESLQIFQSLAPVTNDGTLAKFARLTVSGTAQSSGIQFEFNNIFSTSLQTPDSIMFVRIAIPSGNVRSGTSEYSPTKINFYFSTSPNHDNYRLFTLGTDWINQNKSKGWIDVPIDLSQISEIVGTANIGEIDCFQVELFKDNFSGGSYHDLFIDQVAQIEDKRGTWDGYYKFYYSWIYDRNQESSFFEFPNQAHGIPLALNQIDTKVLIKELSTGGFGARGKRITGANIYYAEFDEVNEIPKYTDPFYLMSCDFERGVKKPNSQILETWSLGTTATDHYTHAKTSFINPEISSTFSINSGYVYNPLDSIEELRFRASAVLNRRVYYGNVDIIWEKASGETNAKYNRYGDRIYKSLPNKPDLVPSYNFLDVDVNDGDEITALESYADRLLVFKKDIMYIVNATQEMEYLEDTHKHKGIFSNCSVVKTDMLTVMILLLFQKCI